MSDWMTNFSEDFTPVVVSFPSFWGPMRHLGARGQVKWSEVVSLVISPYQFIGIVKCFVGNFLGAPLPFKTCFNWWETQLLKMILIILLSRVVQRPIKPTQGKREFWFQFCIFLVRFSIYIVCPSVLSCSDLQLYKLLGVKTFLNKKKIMLQLTFNPELTLTSFRTTRPC